MSDPCLPPISQVTDIMPWASANRLERAVLALAMIEGLMYTVDETDPMWGKIYRIAHAGLGTCKGCATLGDESFADLDATAKELKDARIVNVQKALNKFMNALHVGINEGDTK